MARGVALVGLSSLLSLCTCVGPNPRLADGDEHETGCEGSDLGADAGQSGECPNDGFEPNDAAEAANLLIWDETSTWNNGAYHDARASIDAFLCPGEHDWYRVAIEELGFEDHILRVDGLVRGASWCGHLDGCGGGALDEAPHHTLAIEVYDAASQVLLAANLASNGRVDIDAFGPNFAHDLLIHVYGPTVAASYEYELHVDVRSYDGEDECEC